VREGNKITCPTCEGRGWNLINRRVKVISVICYSCEGRGLLVIDSEATMKLGMKHPPMMEEDA